MISALRAEKRGSKEIQEEKPGVDPYGLLWGDEEKARGENEDRRRKDLLLSWRTFRAKH